MAMPQQQQQQQPKRRSQAKQAKLARLQRQRQRQRQHDNDSTTVNKTHSSQWNIVEDGDKDHRGWQHQHAMGNDIVTRIRANMMATLTSRLEQCHGQTSHDATSTSTTTNNNNKNKNKIPEMAQTLEALLFQTAASMSDYQDPTTLTARLQALLAQLLERRIRKAAQAAAAPAEGRRQHTNQQQQQQQQPQQVLVSPAVRWQILSQSERVTPRLIQQIFLLVRQMELLQVGRPLPPLSSSNSSISSQTSKEQMSTFNSGGANTTTTTSPQSPTFQFHFHLEGQQRLPQPVKELFFRATIVDAFYDTPLHRLADLPWARLQAQDSIRSYHSWLLQHKQGILS